MTSAFSRLLLPSEGCLWFRSLHELPESVPKDISVIAEITDRQAEEPLFRLSQQLGPRLLVPEVWQRLLPDAGILISSQLSGGTLTQRLSEAQEALPGRCWLRLDSFARLLPLPCPSGNGTDISPDWLSQLTKKHTVFYSPELGCCYLYDFPNGIILFRKNEHFDELSDTARQAGFCGTIESA